MCGERAKPQGVASGSVHDLLSLDASTSIGTTITTVVCIPPRSSLASPDFGTRTANIFTPPWNRPQAFTS